MALIPAPTLDYTDKDFDAWLVRVQSMIPQVFPGWTDFNTANFGNTLLEEFSFALDVLSKYMDVQALEAFMVKASQRKNLIALAKQILYVPKNASPATVDVTFTLTAVPANDVVIPEGTIVATANLVDPVQFRLLADLTIAAGTNPPIGVGTVEHSELVQDIYSSNALPNQSFDLSATPVIEIEALQATNGIYSKVDNFLRSRSNDRHFVLVVDQNDRGRIRFGNGVNGEIPTGTITNDFKTGGGPSGNVEPGAIRRVIGQLFDVMSVPVTASVTNTLKASGGFARQSNESIRVQAPESLRATTRSIAREDFEIHARTLVTGVARALLLTSDQDPSVDENTGLLFLVPEGGGVPSTSLKNQVAAIFTTRYEDGGRPKSPTFRLIVSDPNYRTIDVFAVVFTKTGFKKSAVKADIIANLTSFFAITNPDGTPNELIDFGFNMTDSAGNPIGELAHSVVFDVVNDTAGVRKLGDSLTEQTLNGAHQDIVLLLREFPQLGTITLIDGETGQELPDA